MPTLLQGAAALAPNGGMLGAYSWVQCIKGWPHMCEGQLQSKLDRIVFVQPPQGCEPMGWGAPTAASAPVGAWVSMLSMCYYFVWCAISCSWVLKSTTHSHSPHATAIFDCLNTAATTATAALHAPAAAVPSIFFLPPLLLACCCYAAAAPPPLPLLRPHLPLLVNQIKKKVLPCPLPLLLPSSPTNFLVPGIDRATPTGNQTGIFAAWAWEGWGTVGM